MARAGRVFVQDKYAGVIMETEDGYSFAYDEKYLMEKSSVPVSITLPLSKETYTAGVLFPFFDGLIPEGWLLGVVERNWKIDDKDRFGLLLASCRDCIGDVYIEQVSEN